MPKTYCVICPRYGGQIENGKPISLYCLPSGKKDQLRREDWIFRIRSVRPEAVINTHSRVCSVHFESSQRLSEMTPTKLTVDKLAKKRKLRSLIREPLRVMVNINEFAAPHRGDSAVPPGQFGDENIPPGATHPTLPLISVTNHPMDPPAAPLDNVDYPPTLLSHPLIAPIECTTPVKRDFGVQVGLGLSAFDDFSCQTELPHITADDLARSDDKTKFYTSFVNFQTFMLIYSKYVTFGADRLNYWCGEKRSMPPKSYHQGNRKKPGKSLKTQ